MYNSSLDHGKIISSDIDWERILLWIMRIMRERESERYKERERQKERKREIHRERERGDK